jgi:dTDP-D-glucose 4,6-dehydratase
LLALSIKKAVERLGWHPIWNFTEGVSQTVIWYRNRHHLKSTKMLEFSLSQIDDYAQAAQKKGAPWTQ